jgi:hypothetical protein
MPEQAGAPAFRIARSNGKEHGMKLGAGGILVIIGIVLIVLGHWIWGIILALIGLIAFGGFARGRWY